MSQLFRCPSCHEVIRLGSATCRFCSVMIDEQVARAAAAQFEQITQACAAANNLKLLNLTIPILLLLQVYFLFSNPAVGIGRRFGLLSLGGPALVLGWFFKHRQLQTNDADFLQAKKQMKASFGLRAALIIAQAALLFWVRSGRL
jgi:hypothetical protein